MTSYASLLKKLFQLNLFGGMKLQLKNMEILNKALNSPSHQFSSIHVAGTNGKGSVCTKIAKGLQLSGFKTGLYTSPHISSFRERIRIDENMISEEEATTLLNELFQIKEAYNIPCTFFELTTALGFSYFATREVDFAVVETGLGGRLDATNILTPSVSVITSISLDHTDILGSSVEEIALEKAGIIKPNIPVIIGPRVPFSVIREVALKNHSPLTVVDGHYEDFEEENNAIARVALRHLELHPSIIQEALKATPLCRMEIIHHLGKTIVLDVAHNPDGLIHLFTRLKKKYPEKSFRVIFGLSKNKDVETCVSILKKHATHFHLVTAKNGRGMLAAEIQERYFDETTPLYSSVADAIDKALSFDEVIVICGTFFIMAEARNALNKPLPQDAIDMNER